MNRTANCLALTISLTVSSLAAQADGWKRELDVGINGSEGNSESFSLHAGFNAGYKDENDVWKFATAYDQASTDGEDSRNQFFADLQKDWLLQGSPWFLFTQGRYDWDEFKDWDSRVSLSAGAGYQFVQNNTWDVRGRVGLGGSRTYGGTDDDFNPEALLGLDAAWNISKHESLAFSTTFYPSLDNGGEFRNLTGLDWKMTMGGEDSNLAMKIGLINEYDSQAAPGTEENDFKYHLALVWGL